MGGELALLACFHPYSLPCHLPGASPPTCQCLRDLGLPTFLPALSHLHPCPLQRVPSTAFSRCLSSPPPSRACLQRAGSHVQGTEATARNAEHKPTRGRRGRRGCSVPCQDRGRRRIVKGHLAEKKGEVKRTLLGRENRKGDYETPRLFTCHPARPSCSLRTLSLPPLNQPP